MSELYGLAKKTGFTVNSANKDELAMGIQVEMEHTSNPNIALAIALDHLAEVPDYYTRLKKVEQESILSEPMKIVGAFAIGIIAGIGISKVI